ncbi:protein of unknown function [Taphrina deformans PYCC 5710]|uniref:DUF4470 domain-containing protein n=1 Tax=Taphrina deformans (strain PYCC 5710 / ATCC 11124 / CBS 356.35 / IMI 108563 / JCM 9778 / NBRC 8474) TaxID=1097556 RepID=R4XAC8_TAPDE|nr:protein of unknown function [Taphrina deformans PYCC 5710]|eukprot:CCG82712.1 protein of unknown function [Taphrina deformans PYCC 5710]
MEKDDPAQKDADQELAKCSEALVHSGQLQTESLWTSFPAKSQWTRAHADELRIAGNESYKTGALHDAIRFYENAINVATAIQQDDLLPTYLSNLSAAYYESGDYEKALDVIDRAFEHLQADHDRVENPTPLDIKLRVRECRCLLHIQEFDQLLDAVQEVDQAVYDEHIEFGVVEDAALHSLDQLAAWDPERARKLIPRLPRYRPSMRARSGMHHGSTVGHDTANSALTAPPENKEDRDSANRDSRILLTRLQPQQTHLSFFYGGCGDPRHVLATMIDVYQQAPDPGSDFEMKMALVDKNPSVIARNLLIFFILDDLANQDLDTSTTEVTEILTILHYTYLGAIMPDWVHERLLGYIRVVATKLCSGLGVPPWLTMSLGSIDKIIPVFKYWIRGAVNAVPIQDWMDMQRPLDGPTDIFSYPNVSPELKQRLKDSRDQARVDIKDAIFNFSDAQLNTILSNKCANAKKMTLKAKKDLAFKLFATDEALDTLNRKRYVPDGLLMEYSTFYQGSLKMLYGPDELHHKEPKLAEQLKSLWTAWGAAKKGQIETNGAADPRGRSVPLLAVRDHIVNHWKINVTLVEEQWRTIANKSLPYEVTFDPFAASQQLVTCTGVRPLVKPFRTYDYTAAFFLNAARSIKTYSSKFLFEWMVDESHHVLEEITKSPEDYNFDFFDRIYFSGPPDMTGGLLAQAVDSMAILKPCNHAFVASKILHNTSHFSSVEGLFSEYLGLSTLQDAQRFLGLGIHGRFATDFFLADYIRLRPVDPANVTTISLAGKDWKSGPAIHRSQLIDWLFSAFMRIAIPARRLSHSDMRIQQPLNLHSFFRLLIYLQSIDFPAHWLSSVIDDIIQNRVMTRSRPPTTSPQTVQNLASVKGPLKAVCMTPFSMEMEVALTIWFPLLTFGITAVEFADAASIKSYSIRLSPNAESMTSYDETLPLLALWFSTNSAKKINLDLARDIVGNHNAVQSVRLLSTFQWDYDAKTAKFMCNASSMELLQIQNFTVRLIRTDTYETVSVVVPVKNCVAMSSLAEWQEPI